MRLYNCSSSIKKVEKNEKNHFFLGRKMQKKLAAATAALFIHLQKGS